VPTPELISLLALARSQERFSDALSLALAILSRAPPSSAGDAAFEVATLKGCVRAERAQRAC
jgi:hypothetical protein